MKMEQGLRLIVKMLASEFALQCFEAGFKISHPVLRSVHQPVSGMNVGSTTPLKGVNAPRI